VASGNAGQGQTVAIIDPYDAPNFVNSTDPNFNNSDLHKFDQEFGLPDPPSFSFMKVNQFGQSGPLPGRDPAGPGPNSSEVETSLNVEWVHSIAPMANIILVETNSALLSDLFTGVASAAKLPGVSAVSMSFGVHEFSSETILDSIF
jgi:subtilase family serine protease